jgi:hypothetical protein
LDDGLSRKDVVKLGRSNTESQCAKAAMRTGMAVAANDQAAWEAQTKLGPNNVNDALSGFADVKHADAACRCFRA